MPPGAMPCNHSRKYPDPHRNIDVENAQCLKPEDKAAIISNIMHEYGSTQAFDVRYDSASHMCWNAVDNKFAAKSRQGMGTDKKNMGTHPGNSTCVWCFCNGIYICMQLLEWTVDWKYVNISLLFLIWTSTKVL